MVDSLVSLSSYYVERSHFFYCNKFVYFAKLCKLKPSSLVSSLSCTLLAIRLNQTFAVQALLCLLWLLWAGNYLVSMEVRLETINFFCLTIFNMAMDNHLSCRPQKALAQLHLSTQSLTETCLLRTTRYVI
jgi:hypothetical protein